MSLVIERSSPTVTTGQTLVRFLAVALLFCIASRAARFSCSTASVESEEEAMAITRRMSRWLRVIFALLPAAPMARYDRMGLLWLLKGERVVELTATTAKLGPGLSSRASAPYARLVQEGPRLTEATLPTGSAP
jgi:hypothetical protein